MFSYPCWLYHKWGKWVNCIIVERPTDNQTVVNGQKAICERCGKQKVRWL